MTDGLIEFWGKCDLGKKPYFHQEDERALFKRDDELVMKRPVATYADYMNGPEFSHLESAKFHLSLLPIPYGGNLDKAEIVLFLLNPGLSHTDYYGELQCPDYRGALERNLRQDFSKTDFPFLWLNPEFSWHSGFVYWEKKLRDILQIIADKKYQRCYLKALRDLAQKIAMIELVPYHSTKFSAGGLIKDLASAQRAIEYAQNKLMPAASTGQKTLIVLRQSKSWKISSNNSHTIIYSGSESRGAHLSSNSRGGRAILKRYNLS